MRLAVSLFKYKKKLDSFVHLKVISSRLYCNVPNGWDAFPKPEKKQKEKSEKTKDKEKLENKENKDKKDEEEDVPELIEKLYDRLVKDKNGEGGEDNSGKKKFGAFVALLVATVIVAIFFSREKAEKIDFMYFQNELLAKGLVSKLDIINKSTVRVYLRGPMSQSDQTVEPKYYFLISDVGSFYHSLHESMERLGMPEDFLPIHFKTETDYGMLAIKIVPTIFIFGLIYYSITAFVASSVGKMGGSGGIFSMGKSKAKLFDRRNPSIKFKDVAGCDEAKEEIMEFVSFLKNPDRYVTLGAKIPKGALLIGPPGTGKTLLAKATAGEASVPFYSVSGADFVEIFGGVGSSRVRDLFATARKNAPCIVFLDEIDAIGRKREGGSGGNRNEERENTLNQLLVEMDGFASNKGVVVLAGTNRPDVLDKALTRPGRFDRQIALDLPDVKSRVAIFLVHLEAIKLDAQLVKAEVAKRLAGLTPGFSGADIYNVCNEAALIAARKDLTCVGMEDFEAAIDRVIGGLEKKSKVLSPQEKEVVAYHEAGHALVGWLLPHTDPILKVSIIPRGSAALGFAQQLPEEKYLHTQEFLHSKICVLLGGRAAEKVKFTMITSGAQDDLEKVTNLAYSEILKYGMNKDFGSLSFSESSTKGYFGKPYSDQTAEMVDTQVRESVTKFFDDTVLLIENNRDKLELVAQLLLDKEVIHYDDMVRLLGPATSPIDAEHVKYLKKVQPTDILIQAQPTSE
jgi:AFG3 family protein